MKRTGQAAARIAGGLLVSAVCALPQGALISARPGAVNYVEGEASLNGRLLSTKTVPGKTFLNVNEVLSTDTGKAEILLTPGVFLRVGQDSSVRMVSPKLTQTEVELTRGTAIVEVDELVKENNIQILDNGASIRLEKTGLYRFTAGDQAVAQTLDGKAQVLLGDRKFEVGKKHQLALNGSETRTEKLQGDPQETDLYAWSKVRDEYEAAASYSSVRSASAGSPYFNSSLAWGGGYYGSGFAPGWAWNPFWGTYAWMPGDGAYFSPFGYGFYGPSYVYAAPVVVTGVAGRPVPVPVSTGKPPAGTKLPYRPGYFDGQPIRYANPAAQNGAPAARAAYAGRAGYAVPANGGGAARPSAASRASAPASAPSAAPRSMGAGHSMAVHSGPARR